MYTQNHQNFHLHRYLKYTKISLKQLLFDTIYSRYTPYNDATTIKQIVKYNNNKMNVNLPLEPLLLTNHGL